MKFDIYWGIDMYALDSDFKAERPSILGRETIHTQKQSHECKSVRAAKAKATRSVKADPRMEYLHTRNEWTRPPEWLKWDPIQQSNKDCHQHYHLRTTRNEYSGGSYKKDVEIPKLCYYGYMLIAWKDPLKGHKENPPS